MLKHIEDDGDLSVLANDDGSILLVCELCKGQWIIEGAAGPGGTGGGGKRALLHALQMNPRVLERSAISLSDLDLTESAPEFHYPVQESE